MKKQLSPTEEALLTAVIDDRVEDCSALLAQGANPNIVDSSGDPLLLRACQFGQLALARLLIEHGAQMKYKAGRATLLHAATASRNVALCRFLLDRGADVHAEIKDTYAQPLHWAAYQGDPKIIKMFIEAGADVNAKQDDGGFPLLIAANENHMGACSVLINAGADVNATNNWGETAIMKAASGGNLWTLQDLVSAGGQVLQRTRTGKSALVMALEKGHSDVVRHLMQFDLAGLMLEPCGLTLTPLHLAAKNCDSDILARVLAEGRTRVEATTGTMARETPLHLAAQNNRVGNCRLLVAAGANPSKETDLRSPDYLTPFQSAVKSGAVDAVRYFVLECGVDLAQRTAGNKTLTQLAGRDEAMKTALKSLKTEIAVGAVVDVAAAAPGGSTVKPSCRMSPL